MDFTAKWISASKDIGDICPVFRKQCAITDYNDSIFVDSWYAFW